MVVVVVEVVVVVVAGAGNDRSGGGHLRHLLQGCAPPVAAGREAR